MKKFVNIRFPVIIALVLAAGIWLGYAFKFYNTDIIYITISLPVTVIIALALYIFKRSVKPIILLLFTAIIFIAGFFICFNKITDYQKPEINPNTTYSVSGTVLEKTVFANYIYIILDDIHINGAAKNVKISVKYQNSDIFIENGYKVYFDTKLTPNKIFEYGHFNSNAVKNIKYTCSAEQIRAEYKFNLFSEMRSALKDTLYNNLSFSTASICYAMLTGNTGDMEIQSLQSFRYGGVAHIFAVSGLHIGIIFGIFNFLCKRFGFNKWISTALCLICIFFYAGFCGFTSSSLRAAIMCTVLAVSQRFFLKYDGLNTLACAVIILLILNPFYLFYVGFQMSVCAVGGISTLSKKLEKLFSKIKLPKKLCSAAGASFGAQLAVLPVMLNSFGYVSGAGLLLNVIVLPILSIFFAVLFLCTAISMIITPVAGYILPVTVLPFEFISSFLIDAGFENSLISGFGAGLFIPLFIISIIFLSDKINFGKYVRILGFVASANVMIIYIYAASFYPFKGYEIIVSAYYYGGEVLIKSSKTSVLIVTEDATTHSAKTLNKYYSSQPEAIVVLGGENAVSEYGKLNIDCKNVYLAMQIPVQPYKNTTVHYEQSFSIAGVEYEFEDNYSISFTADGIKVCVCAGALIPYKNADIIISSYPAPDCNSLNKIYFNLTEYPHNVKECGDFRFKIKNGILKSADL